MQLCSYVYDIDIYELFIYSLTREIKSTVAIHTCQVWGKLDMSVHLGEMRLNNLRYFPKKLVHMCITKQRCGQALAPP